MGGGWGRERQKKSTVISPWGSQGEKKKKATKYKQSSWHRDELTELFVILSGAHNVVVIGT